MNERAHLDRPAAVLEAGPHVSGGRGHLGGGQVYGVRPECVFAAGVGIRKPLPDDLNQLQWYVCCLFIFYKEVCWDFCYRRVTAKNVHHRGEG